MTGRLPESPTQVVDRTKPVTIYYQNKPLKAFAGDTVASALLATGIDTFSRSFKYHRRRSASCLTGHCSRCTMNVDGRMHIKTCQTTVREGMSVEPHDNLEFDPKAIADSFSWAMPTGFYYKMFYKPIWFWKRVKEIIRAMPGNMAAVKPLAKKASVDSVNLSPEILVIGGGLAGMEAAITAAQSGVRVVLAESDPQLGGFEAYQAEDGFSRVQESIRRLEQFDNIKVLVSTTVSALFPDGLAVCNQTCGEGDQFVERAYYVRPGTVVIATGAGSSPMIFAHNDRPGVMLPEAAQRMIHMWGIKPGEHVLLAGGDDYLAQVALELLDKGVALAGLVDFRINGLDETLKSQLEGKGIKIWRGCTLTDTRGSKRIKSATIVSLDRSVTESVACDTIVASSGRYPRHKLMGQVGARMIYDRELNFYMPDGLPSSYQAAGRVLGLEDPEAIKAQGRAAAVRALKTLNIQVSGDEQLSDTPAVRPVSLQPLLSDEKSKKKTFVCYCHDVNEENIEQAIAEGFNNIETCKRYTTATQGTCQGGMCEANFAHLLAKKRPELVARDLPTTRPPVSTVSLSSLAAGHHDIPQISPLHRVQVEQGGNPMRMGAWMRMMDFGDQEAESLAVHQSVGICDVSMLGKFRVFGPDAEKLLNRVMTKKVDGLAPGKILYYAACNQGGILIDDGVALKMGEHDYFVTTTTGRAPVTEEWFSRWCREEDWKVWMVNLTESRASINVAGPKARDVLAKLTADDISDAALPFLNWAHLEIAGVKTIAMRMGFLGELSYEVLCPSSQAVFLWNRLLEAGEPLGLVPFGLEALNICRLEKGHLVPGLDTDGFTTLHEASFGWVLNKKKTETVGKPILDLIVDEPMQQQVVPFSLDGRSPILDGALVVDGSKQLGRVTSIRYSPLLDKTIGLALVEPHADWREGGKVKLWFGEREVQADFAKPPFYDPAGERMKM